MKNIIITFMVSLLLIDLTYAQKVTVKEMNFVVNEKAAEKKVATALAIQIFNNIGIKINVTPVPGDKANQLALKGDVDGELARIAPYTDANPTLLRVEPSYYGFTSTAFIKKGSSIKLTKKEDLSKYNVGYVRGIAHAQKMSEVAGKVTIANDYDHLFKLLATGKIDVAIDSKINGQEQVDRFGLTNLIEQGKDLAVFDEFIILSKKKELAPIIGAEIKRLRDSGELGLLATKYEELYFPKSQ